jgi:hypothetical protein
MNCQLADPEARRKVLAQEFQMDIFGLYTTFAINLAVTVSLSRSNQ